MHLVEQAPSVRSLARALTLVGKPDLSGLDELIPDLINTNHRIAGGTGTDAVLAICSDKAIPVVFVSASGSEIRDRLPDALIVDKLFTLPRLESAVETAAQHPFRHSPSQDGPTLRVVE